MANVIIMILLLHVATRVCSLQLKTELVPPRVGLSEARTSLQLKMLPGLRREESTKLLQGVARKRSAEVVDDHWFPNRPLSSPAKRWPKSYTSTHMEKTGFRNELHPTNRSPSFFHWNRIPPLQILSDVTTVASKAPTQVRYYSAPSDGNHDVDCASLRVPWLCGGRIPSNSLAEEIEAINTMKDDDKSDMIPLPIHSTSAGKHSEAAARSREGVQESVVLASLLKMMLRVGAMVSSQGDTDQRSGTQHQTEQGHDYMKRSQARILGREKFVKRPFDSLANGLIGKRNTVRDYTKFRKRPFDSLANGLIGK